LTSSVHVAATQTLAVHTPLAHSLPPVHLWPTLHDAQTAPPQSTSDSS
jgi:hypothetical protein